MLAKDNVDRIGYKLFDCGTHWEMHFKRGVYSGNLKQVCTFAVHELGFTMYELEIGVVEMEKAFADGAEFGIFKRFMYPIDRKLQSTKVS